MSKVRHSLLLIALVAGSGVVSVAAPALPITTPAVIEPAGPSPAAPVNVLIAPFRPIGETAKDAWISDAINEQMTSDLSHNPAVHVLHAPTTQPGADSMALARQQHADRLVTGSFQTIDDQIRVNGDVIDPADGKTVAQLKVTGAKRDLFRLEDSLVAELEHALPGVEQPDYSYTVTPVASDGPNQPAENLAQTDNGSSYPPGQIVNNYYYDNGSGHGNYGGYGDYGYPYYGSPFFLYLGGERFHQFHDGDHGGHGNGGHGFDGHDRQIGGGPILNGPTGHFGAVEGPSHGFGGARGPVGGGAFGGARGGEAAGGGAGGHR